LMWARRRPAAALLIVAMAVAGLALVVAGASLAYSGRLRRANELAEQSRKMAQKAYQSESAARTTADEQRVIAQNALGLANRYLYFLRVNQAAAAWRDHAPDRAAALLDECPPELRNWEWHFLDQQRHTNLLILEGHTGYVRDVAYSPDGRHIASASSDRTIKVWDAATGQEALTLSGHAGVVYDV